jgi:hypothetical protein
MAPQRSVVMGQGQGHGTVRNGTVQDMFHTFYVRDILGQYINHVIIFLYE